MRATTRRERNRQLEQERCVYVVLDSSPWGVNAVLTNRKFGLLRQVVLIPTGTILGWLCFQVNAQGAPAYDFRYLGADSSVRDINEWGQSVGYSVDPLGGDPIATLWHGSNVTLLAGIGDFTQSEANAINSAGQIVGRTSNMDGLSIATLWIGGQPFHLTGTLNTFSTAYGISDSGKIVGTGFDSTNQQRAVVWYPNSNATFLPNSVPPSISFANAFAISDTGIVGNSNGQAALWEPPFSTINIVSPQIAPFFSFATDINSSGLIVGAVSGAVNNYYERDAASWFEGVENLLPTLGGIGSEAKSVNSHNEIVGVSISASLDSIATLWRGGEAVDLNDFLSATDAEAGWRLEEATAINDSGWIVGRVKNLLTGEQGGFVLSPASPVPEPHSILLALVGLSILALQRMRLRRVLTDKTFG